MYNPRGNSQCERFNGISWNTIKLALLTIGLDIVDWEMAIPEVLHSSRSLLRIATNKVLHDCFFKFSRGPMFCTNTPIVMTKPGPVYVCKHVRDKYDPVCRRNEFAPR